MPACVGGGGTAHTAQQTGFPEHRVAVCWPSRAVQVRVELAPWEKRIGEVSGRIAVVSSERDVLAKKADDAKRRLDAALKVRQAQRQGGGGGTHGVRPPRAHCLARVSGQGQSPSCSPGTRARQRLLLLPAPPA